MARRRRRPVEGVEEGGVGAIRQVDEPRRAWPWGWPQVGGYRRLHRRPEGRRQRPGDHLAGRVHHHHLAAEEVGKAVQQAVVESRPKARDHLRRPRHVPVQPLLRRPRDQGVGE